MQELGFDERRSRKSKPKVLTLVVRVPVVDFDMDELAETVARGEN